MAQTFPTMTANGQSTSIYVSPGKYIFDAMGTFAEK